MTWRERRNNWERMGLCVNCGGLRLESEYRMCIKCREKQRNYLYGKNEYPRKMTFEEAFKMQPEIPKNHKCWGCVWGKFEGSVFFCPFMECVKRKPEENVIDEVQDEN